MRDKNARRDRYDESYDYAPVSHGKSRKKKKKKIKLILFLVEFLILVGMLGVLYVMLKSDKIERDDTLEKTEAALSINNELQEMQEEAAENGSDWNMAGYTTIALFGVDARDSSLGKGNRTDTIIIASINESNGDVRLASVYRDTYINVGNDTYNKANSAYSHGGPEQAIQMLNTSLDLDIKNYATVNFRALIDTIDALGGVDINVTDEEVVHLNSYQISMSGKEDGLNEFGEKAYKATAGVDYIPVKNAGLQNLNGLQATAYCRIRYVGNDFERTNRQRTVLTAVANKAKNANIATLDSLVDEILPKCMTSFTTADLLGYAAKAPTYSISETTGFPFEQVTGTMGKTGSCVVAVDFANNVKELHSFLYGEDGYTPTDRVQQISGRINSDRVKYLGN